MTELTGETPLGVVRELVSGTDLELARSLALDLERHRLLALGLTAHLHSSHGLPLSRDPGEIISTARDIARELAEGHELAVTLFRDRRLTLTITYAGRLARELADKLTEARTRDHAARGTPIDVTLPLDRALAETRAYADARRHARSRARHLADNLAVARDIARALADDLAATCDVSNVAVSETREQDNPVRPTRPAVGVAWTAAGLLARRDRLTYDLMYRSELADLAASGVSRGQQLRHSARLLIRTPRLRADLAWARRRQAMQ